MGRNPASSEEKKPEGFPEHGAPIEAPSEPPEETPPEPSEGERKPDMLADIRRRLDQIDRDNAELRRRSAPPPPPPSPSKEEPANEDWEREFFANPRAAMNKAMDIATSRVKEDIRSEVQRERNTADFWREFYRRNSDLQDDHDLVEMTLNRNMKELSDLPLDRGYERLAELTRERIVGFIDKGKRPKPKARAEGASSGSGPRRERPKAEDEKVLTLSDIIVAKRNKRRGIVAA